MTEMKISMDEVIELREAKQSWDKIAERAKVSTTYLRKRVGLHPDFPTHLRRGLRPPTGVTSEEFREMVEIEHMSDAEIAQRLGLPTAEAAQKMRNRHGVSRGPKNSVRNSIPEDELKWAEELLGEGNSYSGVSDITGIGFRALRRHFPGRGFTRDQTVEAATMARKLSQISGLAA